MIERISESLAIRIKQANPEETASVEVMKFALVSLLNNTATFVLILLFGAVTGYFLQSCITIAAFMALRIFAGGQHFKSSTLCIVVSFISIAPIPIIAQFIPTTVTYILTLISLGIVAIIAPTNVKKTRIKPSQYPIYKTIALIIVASNFIFVSPLAAAAFFIQSVTSIYIRRENT